MKHSILAALLALLVLAAPAPAAEEPLVDQVKKAIDDGVRFLKERQQRDGQGRGHWEVDLFGRKGGPTCLAMLALLYAGEDPQSDTVQRGLKWLRELEPDDTYVVGLQTMVFAEAKQDGDFLRIQRNVTWLIDARVINGNQMRGWGYKKRDGNADNSNTQYALLGLHAGKSAGAKIDRDVWESIREFYVSSQNRDGGWSYRTGGGSTLTMTTAGLCGLLIAGMELNEGREKLQPNGVATNCGEYAENEAAAKAMKALGERFTVRYPPAWFYSLYGLERAGRLSGQRFFGEFDWYRRGCEALVDADPNKSHRHENGEWYLRGTGFDGSPVVSTSFALLFLSKGRTPVLISKLVHHPLDTPNNGWNNKHNDGRNLVEFASRELFKKQPVAWQIFNARQTGRRNDPDSLAAELLQSPIAYLNGHKAPVFSDAEEKMLVKYVEQGGFVFAEACCGRQEFDAGFRALVNRLFNKDKEHPLRELRPDHPIYTAYFPLLADKNRPLYGIEFGCKTLIVYSPQPLAGWWEAGYNPKDAASKRAFQLAGNVIAYATGLELPKPRGTEVEVFGDKPESNLPRGFLKVAQLKHDGDRHSSLGVTHNLMQHLNKKLGLDVSIQTQEMQLGDKDLLNYKFMYMHGRGEFTFADRDLRFLKANLEDGGLLFADACCGKKQFDASFRKMVRQMFGKDLEPIPLDDDLFSADLNHAAIKTVKCRREHAQGADVGYKTVAPFLEGIKVGDRWAVVYSKYDIGCALEKHQSTDCLGHDYESALRLGSALVLYALQR
jgi:hypothetical protein